ncbi:gp53-like domain-containing protein, partial [Xenorhabdus bovienii]
MILQWGSEPVSNRNFSFPRAFLNECFVVLVT